MKTSAIARGYLPAAAVGFCCVMLTCAVVLADARAVTLYELFEKLNTPKNLRIRYVGGRPPHFITQQSALLRRLANGSPEKIVPFLTKIVDEFLVRAADLVLEYRHIGGMGELIAADDAGGAVVLDVVILLAALIANRLEHAAPQAELGEE